MYKMISTKIYKKFLKAEDDKVYNLWWDKLIKAQTDLVSILEKLFKNWYDIALEEIKNNVELKLMWQSLEISKIATDNDKDDIQPYLELAFLLWMEQLNLAFKYDPDIDISFNIKNQDALDYAKTKAGELITQVDEYTKTRIAWLVEKALDNWWGYDKITEVLKSDYSFSTYRAKLIASHELWNSYLAWKEAQFDKYRKEYNEVWYKNWISHRDSVTTPWCLYNDLQGWIEKNKEFDSSWNKQKPTRFPWCRCNIVYRLFKPKDDRLDNNNATESDKAQAVIKQDSFDIKDIEKQN